MIAVDCQGNCCIYYVKECEVADHELFLEITNCCIVCIVASGLEIFCVCIFSIRFKETWDAIPWCLEFASCLNRLRLSFIETSPLTARIQPMLN